LTHVGQPWWNEVFALAAGIPGCDSALIIRTLLERGAVIEAAKCLETAVRVPPEVRKEVEQALEKMLPPMDRSDVQEKSEIGLTVAPILMRNMRAYSPRLQGYSIVFFTFFEYPPVVPTLLELSSSLGKANVFLRSHELTVGEVSVWVLKSMAVNGSDSAKRALETALTNREWSEEFLTILDPKSVLGDEFKALTAGKPPSKRAKSTAPAPRSKGRREHSRSAK
jgi:hypothetical protein